MYGIIYKATSPVNKVYIGQTTETLAQRKRKHLISAKYGDHRGTFQCAILEFGGVNAFLWEEIDTAYSKDELNQKEIYWIAHYKANNPDYGYNLTEGGTAFSPSPETRRKIGNANRGKRMSDEAKQKNREAHLGKRATTETRRKISEGNRGVKAPSSKLAEIEVIQILTALKKGETCASLGRKYNVSLGTIHHIKTGRNWGWLQGNNADGRVLAADRVFRLTAEGVAE
jgi:group I intron endonuclease